MDLLVFMETYQSLPELCDLENINYSNQFKKAAAYDVLVEKFKVIEPHANREAVTKKMNNLRSSFRKELRRVEESKKSGSSVDSVYVFTYTLVHFFCFSSEFQQLPKGKILTFFYHPWDTIYSTTTTARRNNTT